MKYAIDLGHEVGPDRGAYGYLAEEKIIDEVGYYVIKKLKDLGNTVIEVRPFSASTVGNSLWQRYSSANNNNVDMFISIHANASNGEGHGTEVFTYNGREIPEARRIVNNIASLGFTNRGLKNGINLSVVKNSNAPAILIEICFCDNKGDCDLYTSLGSETIANAIVKGLTGKDVGYKLGWNKDNIGWWYCTDVENKYYYTSKDGWKQIDGEWYIFDSRGYAYHNSWYKSGSYWYYLKESCQMARNEWLCINDDFYYFGDKGGMYSNCYTPDGYWVDKDGSWNRQSKRE